MDNLLNKNKKKRLKNMDEKEIQKMKSSFVQERMFLITDMKMYFNILLTQAFNIINQIKPEKSFLTETMNVYQEFVDKLFEKESKVVDIFKLIEETILEKTLTKNECFSYLLYMKLCVIYGFVSECQNIPQFNETDREDVRVSLYANMNKVIEALNLFIEAWNPNMTTEEINRIIEKQVDLMNRKYDKRSYDIYS